MLTGKGLEVFGEAATDQRQARPGLGSGKALPAACTTVASGHAALRARRPPTGSGVTYPWSPLGDLNQTPPSRPLYRQGDSARRPDVSSGELPAKDKCGSAFGLPTSTRSPGARPQVSQTVLNWTPHLWNAEDVSGTQKP